MVVRFLCAAIVGTCVLAVSQTARAQTLAPLAAPQRFQGRLFARVLQLVCPLRRHSRNGSSASAGTDGIPAQVGRDVVQPRPNTFLLG